MASNLLAMASNLIETIANHTQLSETQSGSAFTTVLKRIFNSFVLVGEPPIGHGAFGHRGHTWEWTGPHPTSESWKLFLLAYTQGPCSKYSKCTKLFPKVSNSPVSLCLWLKGPDQDSNHILLHVGNVRPGESTFWPGIWKVSDGGFWPKICKDWDMA